MSARMTPGRLRDIRPKNFLFGLLFLILIFFFGNFVQQNDDMNQVTVYLNNVQQMVSGESCRQVSPEYCEGVFRDTVCWTYSC